MTDPHDEPPRPESRPPRRPAVQDVVSPQVVRRRPRTDMTEEERAFLARHNAEMPPHHDSVWG